MFIKVGENMHQCTSNNQHSLPNYVDHSGCAIIPSVTTNVRYELYIPFLNQSGCNRYLIVIMKNPSHSFMGSTTNSQSQVLDCSTFHVLEYINYNYKKQYDGIIFLNLFPCYGTSPSMVNQRYGFLPNIYNPNLLLHQEIQDNNNQIFNTLSTYSQADVITAWGSYGYSSQIEYKYYDAQINEVLNIIQNTGHTARIVDQFLPQTLPVFHPRHGLKWDMNYHFIL